MKDRIELNGQQLDCNFERVQDFSAQTPRWFVERVQASYTHPVITDIDRLVEVVEKDLAKRRLKFRTFN